MPPVTSTVSILDDNSLLEDKDMEYSSEEFNSSEPCLTLSEPIVLASQISSSIAGVLALYMTVSLTLHFFGDTEYMKKRRRSSTTGSIRSATSHRDKINTILMNLQMIGAAVFITVRCSIDVTVLTLDDLHNLHYITLSRVQILLNIAAMSSMYGVLWLRQWSFYNHPAMDDSKFKKLRIACLLLPLVMVATGIWNAVAFLMDREIKFDKRGCVVRGNDTEWSVNKFYVLGGCTLFYQLVLMGLFIYPLAHHARSNISTDGRRKKSIFLVMQRVLAASVICCITDLTAAFISVVLERRYPESSFIVYNFNLAINFICLLYTFGDWRLRLLYPCIGFEKIERMSWPTTSLNSQTNANTSAIVTNTVGGGVIV